MTIDDFNNRFTGRLDIELSDEPEPIAPNLANVKASSTATITSLSFDFEAYDEKAEHSFRQPTFEELNEIVVKLPSITIKSMGENVEHKAPNGMFFTVHDLKYAIERTELMTRSQSGWFGGIDVHHVFFEGLSEETDGTFTCQWGS